MVTFLTVIFCILAVCIIYNSGVGAIGVAQLMEHDLQICPEDFLPTQTRGRSMIMYNGICRVLAAGVMLFYGVSSLSGNAEAPFLASPAGLASAAGLLCIASLVAMRASHIGDFKSTRDDIMAQWKEEKHITERHDDEVRLYRVLGEAIDIPGFNARMVVYMGCLYGLSLL